MDLNHENWALIPEAYRETTAVAEAAGIPELVKAGIEAQALIGNSIRVPGDGASDEDKTAFDTKMNELGLFQKERAGELLRPPSAEAYSLTNTPDDPTTLGLSQGMLDSWKEEAYEMGLSQSQFDKLAESRVQGMTLHLETQTEHQRQTTAALEEKWGPQGYEARKRMALNAVKRFGGDAFYDRMSSNPDVEILTMMAEIGQAFEESNLGDLTSPIPIVETPDEAAMKYAEIQNNPNHPYVLGPYKAGSKAYEVGASEVMRLRRIMMGLPIGKGDYMLKETG